MAKVCPEWLARQASNAIQRAKRDYQSYDDLDLLKFALARQNHKVCPLCKGKMERSVGRGSGGSPTSPSIDRRDPALGYTAGNVWLICLGCNMSKGSRTLKEWQEYMEAVLPRLKGLI
jgi:hypothetical protein